MSAVLSPNQLGLTLVRRASRHALAQGIMGHEFLDDGICTDFSSEHLNASLHRKSSVL